jgi:DNA-binding HxlR family transcriptional regulator
METTPRVCSAARALEVVGDRWSLLVLREVFLGTHRFDAMQANTGAPRDILSARLKKLVAHGVLERRPYQEHPPRVEYHATEAGRELAPVVTALRQWGDRHLRTEEGPQPAHFHHVCGSARPAAFVCPDCGEALTVGSMVRVS